MVSCAFLWLGLCLAVHLYLPICADAAQYIYDESVWTKKSWEQLKLPFPLDATSANPDMNGYGLVSSAGPFQQSAYDTKVRERWVPALHLDQLRASWTA